VPHQEPTDEDRVRGQVAFELLHSWSTLPGLTDEFLDSEALQAWVLSVREIAADAGLRKIADKHVGQILSFSPDGGDDLWPHEAVRELIEELANEEIERGFEIQVMNSRGMTTRGYGEGGGTGARGCSPLSSAIRCPHPPMAESRNAPVANRQ